MHYSELLEKKTDKTPREGGCWLFTGRKHKKSGHGLMDVIIPGLGKTIRNAMRTDLHT